MKDIENNINAKGIKKTWLMGQLGISRRTFYKRLSSNDWKPNELSKLKSLNLVG